MSEHETPEPSKSDAPDTDAPIELEPRATEDEPQSTRPAPLSEIHCPGCGAPMPGADTIVCLRCGFDLKTNKQASIETGVEESEVGPVNDEPLCIDNRGGWIAPAVAGAACLLVILVLVLTGAPGLFAHDARPVAEDDSIAFTMRLAQVVRFIVRTAVIAACIAAGVCGVARLERRPIGDWRIVLARAASIAAAAQFIALLQFNIPSLEWTLERAVVLAIAFLGVWAWFQTTRSQTGLAVLIGVFAYLFVYAGALVVAWSM